MKTLGHWWGCGDDGSCCQAHCCLNNTGDDWICGQFDGLVLVIFGLRSPLLYAFCSRRVSEGGTPAFMSVCAAAAAAAERRVRARININSDDVFIHLVGHARLEMSPLQAQHRRRSAVVEGGWCDCVGSRSDAWLWHYNVSGSREKMFIVSNHMALLFMKRKQDLLAAGWLAHPPNLCLTCIGGLVGQRLDYSPTVNRDVKNSHVSQSALRSLWDWLYLVLVIISYRMW